MSSEPAGTGPELCDHADRLRWNAKYAAGFVPSFIPHPLAIRVFGSFGSFGSPSMDLPEGPLAELACGPSGAALLAAANGRRVTAVDVSEIALGMLGDEARRRGLDHLITRVHADLSAWRPQPRSYAVVLCTGFWASAVFTAAAQAVAAGGLLGWEAFTAQARRSRPSLQADWCLAPGEPASLLPPDFTLLDQHDRGSKRQLLARRVPAASPPPPLNPTSPLPTTRPTSRSRQAIGLSWLWHPIRKSVQSATSMRSMIRSKRINQADQGMGGWRWAHSAMSRRSMAAAIRSGNESGVHANAGTPSAARAAALSWS
jgi:hypothetical protein